MKLKLALLSALAFSSVNAMAACYTVYDGSNRVVYNAQTPPVDMSRPLHETLPARYPGGHLVFGPGSDCPRDVTAPVAIAARNTGKAAPLLTDRRTAAALNVPHTILPSGVALVSNPPPMLGGGITVLRPAPATVAQPAPQRRDTVITELHNPPLTVIQQGGMVVSALR